MSSASCWSYKTSDLQIRRFSRGKMQIVLTTPESFGLGSNSRTNRNSFCSHVHASQNMRTADDGLVTATPLLQSKKAVFRDRGKDKSDSDSVRVRPFYYCRWKPHQGSRLARLGSKTISIVNLPPPCCWRETQEFRSECGLSPLLPDALGKLLILKALQSFWNVFQMIYWETNATNTLQARFHWLPPSSEPANPKAFLIFYDPVLYME